MNTSTISILGADDTAVGRTVLEEFLTALGHTAHIVGTGEEVVKVFSTCLFDAVIVDLRMPRMDGFAVAREIRRMEESRGTRPTPIIAFTASGRFEEREECFRAGMNGFLLKPLELPELDRILRTCAITSHSIEDIATPFDHDSESPFSLIRLRRSSLDNTTVALQLISSFKLQLERSLSDLLQAVDNGSVTEVADLAHTLKGAAHLVGADELCYIAEHLEILASESRYAEIRPTLTFVAEEVERCELYIPQLEERLLHSFPADLSPR